MYTHQKDRHPEDWEANKEQIKARNKVAGKLKMRESYRDGTRKRTRWGEIKFPNLYGNDDGEAPILDEETGMMNEDLFQCDFCDKAYITKKYLVSHQKKEHEQDLKDKQWKQRIASKASDNPCPQCGENFPLKSILNEHLAQIHDDSAAMKLQCNMCSKYLGSKVMLDNHIRTHTGEKPFKCDFCPKTFTSSKAMGFHRKEMHHAEWEEQKRQLRQEIEGDEDCDDSFTIIINENTDIINH